jgi:CheY-like chemotaxis protein
MIVLIDDNEIDLFVNRKLLEVEGMDTNIQTFKDPKEGMNFVLNHPEVEIVLIDNVMPQHSGIEIANLIRQNGRDDLFISILTATLDQRKDLTLNEVDGSVQVLEKPLNVAALKHLLLTQMKRDLP